MLRKKWFWFLLIIVLLGAYVYAELSHPRFGVAPSGERQKRIEATATYKDGKFHNTMPEPTNLVKDNYIVRMYNIHFNKDGARTPQVPIPTAKTDLKSLDIKDNLLVALGHSSYYMQLNGLRFLIDPVFNDYAAPFSFLNRAFEGTTIYTAEDMPYADYILITHDHYDHLDYDTMLYMLEDYEKNPKFGKFILPLGLGAYFEYWGFSNDALLEGYWYDSFILENNVEVTILPARHYSSRLFDTNKTLWAGFGVVTPDIKIFFSGDTGYGDHFQEISEKFDGFDFGIMDVGQFNPEGWPHIHLIPEHAAKAGEELKLKRFLPGHNSKFAIALHDWKAPLELITEHSQDKEYTLITPLIGNIILFDNEEQTFPQWWENIE